MCQLTCGLHGSKYRDEIVLILAWMHRPYKIASSLQLGKYIYIHYLCLFIYLYISISLSLYIYVYVHTNLYAHYSRVYKQDLKWS